MNITKFNLNNYMNKGTDTIETVFSLLCGFQKIPGIDQA